MSGYDLKINITHMGLMTGAAFERPGCPPHTLNPIQLFTVIVTPNTIDYQPLATLTLLTESNPRL